MANIKYVPSKEWVAGDAALKTQLEGLFFASGSAGVWSVFTGGAWTSVRTGGCFGSMPSTPGIVAAERIRVILHLGMGGSTTSAQKEWWHTMVLDKDTSPWKDAILEDPIIYLGTEKYKYKSVLEIKVLPTQSFSNVMNMLIATRQSRVEPSSVKKVSKAYLLNHEKHGMTFAEALAYACITTSKGRINPSPQIFISGNGWLTSGRDFDARHMAQRRFAKSENAFTVGDYYPSCSTWQSGKGTLSLNTYFANLGKTVNEKEPIMTYDWYGEPFTKSRYVSYDATVEQVLTYLRSDIK